MDAFQDHKQRKLTFHFTHFYNCNTPAMSLERRDRKALAIAVDGSDFKAKEKEVQASKTYLPQVAIQYLCVPLPNSKGGTVCFRHNSFGGTTHRCVGCRRLHICLFCLKEDHGAFDFDSRLQPVCSTWKRILEVGENPNRSGVPRARSGASSTNPSLLFKHATKLLSTIPSEVLKTYKCPSLLAAFCASRPNICASHNIRDGGCEREDCTRLHACVLCTSTGPHNRVFDETSNLEFVCAGAQQLGDLVC